MKIILPLSISYIIRKSSLNLSGVKMETDKIQELLIDAVNNLNEIFELEKNVGKVDKDIDIRVDNALNAINKVFFIYYQIKRNVK